MLVKLINGLNIVEADQHHHGFFPNHLLLVLHQSKHYVLHSCNDVSVAEFGNHV